MRYRHLLQDIVCHLGQSKSGMHGLQTPCAQLQLHNFYTVTKGLKVIRDHEGRRNWTAMALDEIEQNLICVYLILPIRLTLVSFQFQWRSGNCTPGGSSSASGSASRSPSRQSTSTKSAVLSSGTSAEASLRWAKGGLQRRPRQQQDFLSETGAAATWIFHFRIDVSFRPEIQNSPVGQVNELLSLWLWGRLRSIQTHSMFYKGHHEIIHMPVPYILPYVLPKFSIWPLKAVPFKLSHIKHTVCSWPWRERSDSHRLTVDLKIWQPFFTEQGY